MDRPNKRSNKPPAYRTCRCCCRCCFCWMHTFRSVWGCMLRCLGSCYGGFIHAEAMYLANTIINYVDCTRSNNNNNNRKVWDFVVVLFLLIIKNLRFFDFYSAVFLFSFFVFLCKQIKCTRARTVLCKMVATTKGVASTT